MQFGPGAYTRSPGQQAHGFAAVAKRQNEQPRPAILAALRIAHHRTTAVVDLPFFSRSRENDARWLRTLWSAQLAHEALHRLIATSKTVVRDQVLPDGHSIPATTQSLLDQLAVCRTGTRRWRGRGTRNTRFLRKRRNKAGGHLYGDRKS